MAEKRPSTMRRGYHIDVCAWVKTRGRRSCSCGEAARVHELAKLRRTVALLNTRIAALSEGAELKALRAQLAAANAEKERLRALLSSELVKGGGRG